MSDAFERALGWFVAPAAADRADAGVRTAVEARLQPPDRFAAAVGSGRDALAVAAVVALELRRDAGAATACVAVWSADPKVGPAPAGPAAPGAARAASRLSAHGFDAAARGRLVWARLADDPAHAVAVWERLAARAGVPIVLALVGPRPSEFESLLRQQERIVVVVAADADPALGELAVASLTALGPPTEIAVPLAPAARALALAGVVGVSAVGRPAPGGGLRNLE